MSGFAVNRFEMNKGCGVKSGRWTFEEFMFSDSIFGSAIVEYETLFAKPDKRDNDLFGPGMNSGDMEIFSPVVKELVVFDDDGNSVPLDPAAVAECTKIVLEAFEVVKSSVEEFERGLLC